MNKTTAPSINDAIIGSSGEVINPNGTKARGIENAQIKKIAERYNVTSRTVEITALDLGVVPHRYLRNIGSIGIGGQIKLRKSRVAVVGLGGLGGGVARALARVGVGELVLIDYDVFSESNLNRQEFSYEKNLGRSKVREAVSEIGEINSSVGLFPVEERVDETGFIKSLKGAAVVVDALDTISSRFALERAAKRLGIPLIHGSIAGFSGQVSVIFPEDAGFRKIYGSEPSLPDRGVEVFLGNLPGVVGVVSSLEAVEVIKIITGIGETLRNKLLFIDAENGFFEILDL